MLFDGAGRGECRLGLFSVEKDFLVMRLSRLVFGRAMKTREQGLSRTHVNTLNMHLAIPETRDFI